jgi:hypothetical protein
LAAVVVLARGVCRALLKGMGETPGRTDGVNLRGPRNGKRKPRGMVFMPRGEAGFSALSSDRPDGAIQPLHVFFHAGR